MKDERLLCAAGDTIDNAVFSAIQALSCDELDWDMSLVGEVSDFIEALLFKRGLKPCRPWQNESEDICYSTNDRCAYCKSFQVENSLNPCYNRAK